MLRFIPSIIILLTAEVSFGQQMLSEDTSHYSVYKGPLDYMIFGVYAGMCSGHCSTMYKIDGASLGIDDPVGHFNRSEMTFKDNGWKDSRYEMAKSLLTKIPEELVASKSERFGCPDCVDGGGIYVELKMNSVVKKFYIDTDENQVPDFLKAFVQAITCVVRSIRPKHF